VLDLARAVLELTGSSSPIEFAPLPADDPTRRRPDIALARRALGWEPVTPLEVGLRRTADAFIADARVGGAGSGEAAAAREAHP
jgi:dTDP-glucose 4,6-dehydratase